MRYTLYSNNSICRALLVYLFETNSKIKEVDILRETKSLYSDNDKENYLMLFSISNGKYELQYKNHTFYLYVNQFIDNRKLITTRDFHSSEILKEIILDGETLMPSIFEELSSEAISFFENKLNEHSKINNKFINKYIYNSKDKYWDLMTKTKIRSLETLFLKQNEKTDLLNFVNDFLSEETKADYEKFNIPYKANILLYGKPGTGKTSTILTIASALQLNIGLIPISPDLSDIKLIDAMNSIKKNDCKIIVLEDVDCLFVNRKDGDVYKNNLTLSGLLNCLDGLFRNDGIIVFMTANNITEIDDAMIRSSRIDYKLYYDFANEYQAKECFTFYFPDKIDLFEKVYKEIQYRKFTIAMLQQFFFKYRHSNELHKHINELIKLIEFSEKKDDETSNEKNTTNLYM